MWKVAICVTQLLAPCISGSFLPGHQKSSMVAAAVVVHADNTFTHSLQDKEREDGQKKKKAKKGETEGGKKKGKDKKEKKDKGGSKKKGGAEEMEEEEESSDSSSSSGEECQAVKIVRPGFIKWSFDTRSIVSVG